MGLTRFPSVKFCIRRRYDKTPHWAGFCINGGVVNLNGIEHTKALHCSSQITGKLQGNLPCFYPIYHLKILEFTISPKHCSKNYQGIFTKKQGIWYL